MNKVAATRRRYRAREDEAREREGAAIDPCTKERRQHKHHEVCEQVEREQEAELQKRYSQRGQGKNDTGVADTTESLGENEEERKRKRREREREQREREGDEGRRGIYIPGCS